MEASASLMHIRQILHAEMLGQNCSLDREVEYSKAIRTEDLSMEGYGKPY